MAKASNPRMIDLKRNNKVALRNFNEACDFHDVVKVLLVRMLRRKHPSVKAVPIYTEFNPDHPQENFPDIWMRIKGDVYVWEIQEKVTKAWQTRIIKQHENADVIIVPLPKLSRNIGTLIKQLEDYVI